MKLKNISPILLMMILLVSIFSCQEDELQPDNGTGSNTENSNDQLVGTWSLEYPVDASRNVQYLLTFKADSTAILSVGVLSNTEQTFSNSNLWQRNGDIACISDTIFYQYSLDGKQIRLTKDRYTQKHPSKDINEFWETSLLYNDDKIDLTTFKLLDVYRYDYDHNGYSTTSFNAYGSNEMNVNGEVVKDREDAMKHGTGYDLYRNPVPTAAAASRRGENASCPVACDAYFNILTDPKGNPIQMSYYNRTTNKRTLLDGGFPSFLDKDYDGVISVNDTCFIGSLQKLN